MTVILCCGFSEHLIKAQRRTRQINRLTRGSREEEKDGCQDKEDTARL